MLSRALKMTFWVMYDHLGKLLLANLIWALAIMAPGSAAAVALLSGDRSLALFVGVPLLAVTLVGIVPVGCAGLAHMVKVLIDERDGALRDFFAGVRLYWLRAMTVGVAYAVALACLGVSVWFYAAKLQGAAPILGYALSAVALWMLVFVLLAGMYLIPALVQKKSGVAETLKLAALLVLDNPVFSIGLALQFVVLLSLSVVPMVFVLVTGTGSMVLASSAYEMLARKYARLQAAAQEQPQPTDGPVRPVTRQSAWPDDENDDYLNRGFRDALFPWKG